jgi:DNA-binding response OmpR family regulator
MKRILVVDDSEIVLEACRMALEEAGFWVKCIKSPTFSLKDAEEIKPDLALVDVMFPGSMTGDSLAQFMKMVSGDFPVFLFSDIAEEELKQRAEKAGVQGYIRKSWGLDEMVKRIESALTKE